MKWAAKWLGTSEARVRAAIARGELAYVDLGDDRADLQGRHYFVTLAALEDYVMARSRRRSPGGGGGVAGSRPVPPSVFLKGGLMPGKAGS